MDNQAMNLQSSLLFKRMKPECFEDLDFDQDSDKFDPNFVPGSKRQKVDSKNNLIKIV